MILNDVYDSTTTVFKLKPPTSIPTSSSASITPPTQPSPSITLSDSSVSNLPSSWNEPVTTTSSGEIRLNSAQQIYLIYQTSPIWLLSITVSELEVLYIDSLERLCQSFDDDALFSSVYTKRWNEILKKVQEKRFEDVSSSSTLLVLVSGDLDFVQSTSLRCSSSYTLGLIDRYCKMRRKLPSGLGKWSQVSHSYIGGPTSFATLWYQNNFLPFLTLPKGMKHNISHFIHHGIRGKPILPDDQSSFAPVSSLLSLSKATRIFCYPTPSSRTGFAARALDSQELNEMFSFPPSVQLCAKQVVSHAPVPMDMIRALLNVTLSSLGSSPIIRPPVPSLKFSPHTPDPRGTFLATLNCWLSPTWSVDKKVETSVKHDDAKANVSLWNSRIILPLVSTTRPADKIEKLIVLLRALVSRYVCRRIFQEFMGYLRVCHASAFIKYYQARVTSYVFPTAWLPEDCGHFSDDGGGSYFHVTTLHHMLRLRTYLLKMFSFLGVTSCMLLDVIGYLKSHSFPG